MLSELVSNVSETQVTLSIQFSYIRVPLPIPLAPLGFDFVHPRNGYRVLGPYAITLSFMHILSLLLFFLSSHGFDSPLHGVMTNSRKVPI